MLDETMTWKEPPMSEPYRFPLDAKVEWIAPRWQYLSVTLNTNGRDYSVNNDRGMLDTLGADGWEVIAVWTLPGGMLRALLKRQRVN